jgi:hypothetical protein
MILDSQEQKTIMLEMIRNYRFGGDALEAGLMFKRCVENAEVKKPDKPCNVIPIDKDKDDKEDK